MSNIIIFIIGLFSVIMGIILLILSIFPFIAGSKPKNYCIISEEMFKSTSKEEIHRIYFTNTNGKREVIYLDNKQYKELVKGDKITLTISDYNKMAYDCSDK